MTDTDGLLSERIADLEQQLVEKDEIIAAGDLDNKALDFNLRQQIATWKEKVIKWQDTDTQNQEIIEAMAADIANLTRGFIDVDDALKKDVRISQLEQAIQNTLDTGMTRYIKEVLEK